MNSNERERIGLALTEALTYIIKTPDGNTFVRYFEHKHKDVIEELLDNKKPHCRVMGFAPQSRKENCNGHPQ